MMIELDDHATQQLALRFMMDVRAYLQRFIETPSRSRCFEVLNALAVGTANVLEGADRDVLRRWFDECLDQQQEDVAAAQGQRTRQ